MSVTGGFFNSLSGDRKYNAEQLSSIFDGIITEGVFEHFGDCFKVRIDGLRIIIGSGRAWLNSKWLLNDSELIVDLPAADPTLPRYDAIIFDMNSDADTRENNIVVKSGTALANPLKPTMVNEETHKQYPICYVYRTAGQVAISNANVEIMIGKSDLPYITAPLQSISVQQHFDKWDAEFNTWFATIKDILDDNVATALYNEIDKLKTRMTTAEGNIARLQTDVGTIQNELADKNLSVLGYRKLMAKNTDIEAGSTLTTGTLYAFYEE